ncbi:unnamed protein product [Prunus armeniaca]|uniref:KEN domain-containing protein n=1 Tax=Prunus armeniaca TaxID=36596 RepID=A0A6J5U6J5_PRUAR|nr:unnamed protein product [Prunus armeniaca]
MQDQKEFFHFVETLHAENNKHNQVIGSGVYLYSFKFNPNISQEFYEGYLYFERDGQKVQNVAFVKVVGEHADVKAIEVFHRTRTAIDDVVLRPWTYLFSQQKDFSELPHDTELRKGIWSLCYDRFEHNLKDWTKLAKPKPKGIAYNDKLKLPIKTCDGRLNDFWRDSISELISGVGRIHSKGLYHGKLRLRSNYVFINECMKIINVEGSLDELKSDDERCTEKKKDIFDIFWMLDQVFQSLGENKNNWLECRHFFEFVKDSRTLKLRYDDFIKKVAGHPFLLSADKRINLFDDYECKRTDETTGEDIKLVLGSSEFDTFKSWNNAFLASTGTSTNVDNFMLGVYNHGKYSGDVEDLLRYLRNLKHHYHQHGLAAGSMVDVDRGLSKHFGGFLELLYKKLEV